MAWVLVEQRGLNAPTRHVLQAGQRNYIDLADTKDRLAIDAGERADTTHALACITLAEWGVKLEALSNLLVLPANPLSDARASPSEESYSLNCSAAYREIIFLRDGDSICPSELGIRHFLTLKYEPTAIQVDSTAAAKVEVTASNERHVIETEVQDTARDDPSDTEDEDLDRAVTITPALTNPHDLQATPVSVIARTEVVEETPTTNRTFYKTEEPTVNTLAVRSNTTIPAATDAAISQTTSPSDERAQLPDEEEQADNAASELPKEDEEPRMRENPGSTRMSGFVQPAVEDKSASRSSPIVLIEEDKGHSKRKIDFLDDSASAEPPPARSKRAKNTYSDTVKAKARSTHSRKTVLEEQKGGTDINLRATPASSASSVVGDSDSLWLSDPPKVAFSNSTLPERPQLMKFLKKHGGSTVESVSKGKCNLLCVREGPIRKSMKLLSCIALGVPIVTDRWLIESAQQNRLLDPAHFMPKVPEQEKEWGFSLSRVWGKHQHEVLKGLTVYFTPMLKHSYADFKEIQALCRLVGARDADSRPAAKIKTGSNMLFLALENKEKGAATDPDCKILLQNGYIVYTRDLITSSILRGQLDLESGEFKIKEATRAKKAEK